MMAAVAIQGPVISEAKRASYYKMYWTNYNSSGVVNGPTTTPKFKVASGKKLKLNAIQVYHHNYWAGKTPGTVTLKKGNTVIGKWKAKAYENNRYWEVFPNKTLSAGTYTIVSSSKSTWSTNSGSNYVGFAEVRGTLSSAKISVGKPTIKSIKYYQKTSKEVDYLVKWSKVSKAKGYQVQASTDSKFKKILSQGYITGQNNDAIISRTTGNKDGEKIYVRVRAYKKSGSKKVYGSWSKTKSYRHYFTKR